MSEKLKKFGGWGPLWGPQGPPYGPDMARDMPIPSAVAFPKIVVSTKFSEFSILSTLFGGRDLLTYLQTFIVFFQVEFFFLAFSLRFKGITSTQKSKYVVGNLLVFGTADFRVI